MLKFKLKHVFLIKSKSLYSLDGLYRFSYEHDDFFYFFFKDIDTINYFAVYFMDIERLQPHFLCLV